MAYKFNTLSHHCQYANVFYKRNALPYDLNMSELQNNIKREMHAKNWNAYDLEKASGVPQPTIQRIISGKHGDPRSSTIKKLARGLGLTEAQLRGFHDPSYQKIDIAPINNVGEGQSFYPLHLGPFSKIPVVGQAQLGDNGHWCEIDYPVGYGDGHIDYPSRDANAYALRCVGDSMKPRIKDGEFVIIEPNSEPIPGDEVLVKSVDGRVMVKTLLYIRDDRVHLLSINETHPPQSLALVEIEKMHPVTAIVKKALWVKDD